MGLNGDSLKCGWALGAMESGEKPRKHYLFRRLTGKTKPARARARKHDLHVWLALLSSLQAYGVPCMANSGFKDQALAQSLCPKAECLDNITHENHLPNRPLKLVAIFQRIIVSKLSVSRLAAFAKSWPAILCTWVVAFKRDFLFSGNIGRIQRRWFPTRKHLIVEGRSQHAPARIGFGV